MTDSRGEQTASALPVGTSIIAWALVAGAGMAAVAKAMGQVDGPLMLLGAGVAFWVTGGFLIARSAAKGRGMFDGTVWAGTTMSVYLCAWLLSYTALYGLQQTAGFGAAWLDNRIFFVLIPAASALLGLLAAASLRAGALGDACLAASVAWSVPEIGYAFVLGWQHTLLVALPTALLAGVPLATSRRRVSWMVFVAACVAGGVIAALLLRAVDGRFL